MKMIRTAFVVAALFTLVAPVVAQTPQPTDRIKLDVSRAELTVIAQGLMKLPYEQAAPILNDLSAQLNAQEKKPDTAPSPVDPEKK